MEDHRYNIEMLTQLGSRLEQVMSPLGIHVAVGGSCLYRGWSDKDMDIFLYPHDNIQIEKTVVINALSEIGFTAHKKAEGTRVPDVYTAFGPSGEQVDFFFLSRY